MASKFLCGQLEGIAPHNFLAVGAIAPIESAPMTESHLAWERKFLELSFPGAKVPGSESSWERKFQELSLPGVKVPGNESSRERKFHTMVLSLAGAKVLRSESSIILCGWCGFVAPVVPCSSHTSKLGLELGF